MHTTPSRRAGLATAHVQLAPTSRRLSRPADKILRCLPSWRCVVSVNLVGHHGTISGVAVAYKALSDALRLKATTVDSAVISRELSHFEGSGLQPAG